MKVVSDSPDGKYQCVIKEQLPARGYDSPYLYTFTIKDNFTGRDLKGVPFEHYTDSVSLQDLKIEWMGNELKVRSLSDRAGYFIEAKINNSEQEWMLVRK